MLVHVFLFGCQPAPDMALRFVHIQHFPGFLCQVGVDLHEPVRYVLMYSALADAKFPGCLSDCGVVVNDIIGDADRTLFDIILQR